jgi:hypothetical protein
MNDTDFSALARRFFGVIAQPRTYGNIAYIWLGFPLGLFYFIFLVTGSALSIGLSLLWIGLLLMVAMVFSIRSLGLLERFLSRWLLGEPFPAMPPRNPSLTAWQRFRAVLRDPATWRGGLFLLLKFPIGLASWVFSVATFSISLAFLVAPFARYTVDADFDYWTLEDPTGGWLFAALGVLMLFATLHAHNLLGMLWRIMARYLLSPSELPSEPGKAEPPAPLVNQELQPA